MFSKLKDYFTHEDKALRDNRWIFTSMLVGAILSLIASFVLSVEAIELARNPNAVLTCSVNAIINCATVASHPSATLFGFPNSFLGLLAEPVVITVAIAGLAGVKFPRKFMFAAQICYALGFVFAYYLLYMSMFVIQALCPWCLLVTLSTTFVFFSMTRYNIREDNLYLSARTAKRAKEFIKKDYDKFCLAVLLVVVVAGIIIKYGGDLFA
ncbi:vitamin K epoxide reductase family protein [Candidatus Saccharibacteria bacterium]|nr:vitamin K epoxide reductase family protein [Candidatus Saccharibacteria bacterium]